RDRRGVADRDRPAQPRAGAAGGGGAGVRAAAVVLEAALCRGASREGGAREAVGGSGSGAIVSVKVTLARSRRASVTTTAWCAVFVTLAELNPARVTPAGGFGRRLRSRPCGSPHPGW